ncbi:Lrp/AsnC family transcriptional regulator [Roseibium aggregatum]|uniref:siroheme decarboxylase n=1 Tax=Roseibium aggregatum TaxID=187304 RepID=A0A939EJA9_9HYPH|nr:Lrp/AsnC family transcriptional regulator [Roseibium aggregatum]MBN9672699.1 Lrp/AsnC family transcriptional regulator [Roseibium aggregatum]
MERIGDPIDLRLLDDWQRNLPIVPRPFFSIGQDLGCGEKEVVRRLNILMASGKITRVGATCAPNTVSASTLAALAAPEEKLEAVAEVVGRQPGVNHSYQREDRWNLWFVATGPDKSHVTGVLRDIELQTGLRVLDLPLVRPFNVDLGFSLNGGMSRPPVPRPVQKERLREGDNDLLQLLTTGMPLTERPFLRIAETLNRREEDVLERVSILQEAGIIARLGVIVRHRALGWRANAMVVWDIEPERIDLAGPQLAAQSGVTLCYERHPVQGVWPFRLYCMIHAQSRKNALETLARVSRLPELEGVPHRVLFSSRCFKQTGAMIAHRGAAA